MATTRRRHYPTPQYKNCGDCGMGLPCPHVARDIEFEKKKYGKRGNAPSPRGKKKGT